MSKTALISGNCQNVCGCAKKLISLPAFPYNNNSIEISGKDLKNED